jgi:hypothetical protein
MDCTTARLLLEFARPGGTDLEPADVAALEQHLAGCQACHTHMDEQQPFDLRIGAAMRRVEPPVDLRQRVLDRLEADRNAWNRARGGRILRWAAAAAAVLLGGWGLWEWLGPPRSSVDPERVWTDAVVDPRPSREDVEASFRRQGERIIAPDFAYNFLTTHGLAELPGYPGRVVPQLVFQDLAPAVGVRFGGGGGAGTPHAIVWVLDTRRFSIAGLDGKFESPTGSSYRIDILHQPGARFAYLVLHNGQNLDWLKPPEPPAT